MYVNPINILVFATFLFGASNVAQKAVFSSLDAWTSMGYRGALAFLVLAPFALRELRRVRVSAICAISESLPVCFWFLLGMSFQLLGAEQTSASNVGFLINTCVVFTPLIVWGMTGACPAPRIWLSVAMCFGGVVMLTGGMPQAFAMGDAICLASALAYAAWIVALGRAMSRVSMPITVACLQWFAPAIAGLALGEQVTDATALLPQIHILVFLGVVVSGLGFALAAKAQTILPACTVAVVYALEAVFGAGLAQVFLGEQFTALSFVGAMVTLASTIVAQCNPLAFWQRRNANYIRIEPRLL
jgi:drug/metabolite transporter (DMT)-like permease